MDGAFFAALKRAHDIHAQCKSMLISEQHKAGYGCMLGEFYIQTDSII